MALDLDFDDTPSTVPSAPESQIVDVEQGTDEWHNLRAGVLTASLFYIARQRVKSGPKKGSPTKGAMDLAFRLAIERISGKHLNEGHDTWQAERGRVLEEDAANAHEMMSGYSLTPGGFVLSNDRKFGASPDRLIDPEDNPNVASAGGAEYKAFLSSAKIRSIIIDQDLTGLREQMQGAMWLMPDRKWWHFGLYCPALAHIGLDFTLHVEHRDDAFIESMAEDLWAFDALIEDYVAQLRNAKPILE